MEKQSKDKDDRKLENFDEVIEDIIDENDEESIDDEFFRRLTGLLGEEVLVVTEAAQLNLLGQTFRPIFIGPIVEVEMGYLTIFPATIKILNAPFYQFPTPLSIPLEKIAHLTPDFDSDTRFPLV